MSKIFPKSANALPLQIVIFVAVLGGVVTAGVTYYATPKYLRVGFQPVQPVPFPHDLHAGQLGIDCRYCHASVEKSATSSIPSSQTCMNCHNTIKATSPLFEPIVKSYKTGQPVPWVKIHQLPDYVYFNHSAHVNRGVGCVECHGKVNEMPVVYHAKSLSMGFCLDCHRDPVSHFRYPKDVFNLNRQTLLDQGKLAEASKFIADWKVKPPQSCSGCHR